MTLNYSHRPIFPASCMPEENVGQGGCSQEKDIHDILPDDPFGMDISSTVTAITGWLEDLGVSEYGGYQGGEIGVDKGHYPFFTGFNVWWDTSMDLGWKKTENTMFRSGLFSGSVGDGGSVSVSGGVCYHCFSTEGVVFGCGKACAHENKNNGTIYMDDIFDVFVAENTLGHFVGEDSVHHGGELMTDVLFDSGDNSGYGNKNREAVDWNFDETNDESPHMAMNFALAYLDIHDLLRVERVCKSLRNTIQNDPLLWKNIQIDHPLNDRITDDVLIQLTSRAQGHLQCLSLVECKGITDDGLRRVLESNPRLTKLGVSGCIKVTTEGVLSCLKAFQVTAISGINRLRIAGHVVTPEQFEELILLLRIPKSVQSRPYKPRFFNRENLYVSCEDERPIDIELCPMCEKLKLVYSCTAETCQGIDKKTQPCKACATCIPRCEQCGRCVFNLPHVETFCLGYLCTDCSPETVNYLEMGDIWSSSSKDVGSCDLDG